MMKSFFINIVMIFCFYASFSQTDCINFSDLNRAKVICQYGTYSNPYQNIGVVNGRHTIITDTNEHDIFTNNILPTIPQGDTVSIRLGNNNVNAESESISYIIDVDTNNFSLLILNYAIFLENPNHNSTNQPKFTIQILDTNNNLISPQCGNISYYSNDSLGWNSTISPFGNEVLWKDWTALGIDLSQYQNTRIKLRLTTYDCAEGGHFGYAYFTLKCNDDKFEIFSCGNDSLISFKAPIGFNYEWYNINNPSIILSTQRAYSINVSDNFYDYYCICSSLDSPLCNFRINIDSVSINFIYALADFEFTSELVNCYHKVSFNNKSTLSNDGIIPDGTGRGCESYKWIFHDGEVSTQVNPIKYYNSGGTYQVMLISSINNGLCSDTIIKTVELISGSDSLEIIGENKICDGQSTTLSTSEDFNSYLWSTGEVTNSITVSPTTDTIYYLTAIDSIGCYRQDSIYIRVGKSYSDTIKAEIYFGEKYTLNGFNEDKTGIYVNNYQSILGCDSNFVLDLKVYHLRFPNVVTPNGDGINDVFEIIDLLEQTIFTETQLYIYNRQGKQIYYKNNIKDKSQFWNPNNTNSTTGTYFFRFIAKGIKNKIDYKGVIEVLR